MQSAWGAPFISKKHPQNCAVQGYIADWALVTLRVLGSFLSNSMDDSHKRQVRANKKREMRKEDKDFRRQIAKFVKRVLDGDTDAFGFQLYRLLHTNGDRLILRQSIACRDTRDSLLSDAIMGFWTKIKEKKFKGPADNAWGYYARILDRRKIDYFRSIGVAKQMLLEDEELEDLAEDVLPDKQVVKAEEIERIARCRKKLPKELRRVVELRYDARMTLRQIERMLNKTVSHVRTMLKQAHNLILRCLRESDQE